ncbi:MAG: hypothetical protein ACR2PQ_05825 [Myxococcota bacterium]
MKPWLVEDFIRPLDDTDPEMKAYLEQIHTGGGCPTMPRARCRDAFQPYADGGERLARYLVHHIEASHAEGYPRASHYLTLLAYTRSETGFQYLSALADEWEPGAPAYVLSGIQALGKTGDERALDSMLRLLAEEGPDSRAHAHALLGVFRLLDDTGSRRADAVHALRRLRKNERFGDYVAREMSVLGIE